MHLRKHLMTIDVFLDVSSVHAATFGKSYTQVLAMINCAVSEVEHGQNLAKIESKLR